MVDRRAFLARTASAGALGRTGSAVPPLLRGARAQDLQSLTSLVPAAPGGGWDQTARVMEQVPKQAHLVGTTRVVNVGGAGGMVGLPQFVNQYQGQGDALMLGGMVMIGAIIANRSPRGAHA